MAFQKNDISLIRMKGFWILK